MLDFEGGAVRRLGRVPGLDGVRGVAVLLVVGLHFGSLWAGVRPGGLVPGGYVGVDVFFVLSGFLITSLLVDERDRAGGVSFRRFYARRGLRLLPALYVVLLAHVLYTIWVSGSLSQEFKQVAEIVLYVSNFGQIYGPKSMITSGIGLTWSLAIEEQFYLVWPALLLLGILPRCRTRAAVLWTIGAGVALSLLIRMAVWTWGSGYPAAYMRPDCRADGLLLGALCAFLWRWGLVPRRGVDAAAVLGIAFLAFVALFVQANTFMFDGGFTLAAVAAAAVILAVLTDGAVARVFTWPPLRVVGVVSYGVYLWHPLALRIVAHAWPTRNRPLLALGGLVVAAAAVTLSWFVVEQPFLRLKDRLHARQSSDAELGATRRRDLRRDSR